MKRETPSVTALGVAIRIALIGRDGKLGHVAPAGAADMTARLLETVPFAQRYAARIGGMQRLLALGRAVDRLFVPGMALHLATRKRYIEDQARDSINAGVRQVVVPGAGFDTLAPRLAAERPDLQLFELDHPATQSAKAAGLHTIEALRPNLHLIPCDLAHQQIDRILLDRAAFQRSSPSYFVLEGVLMYLDRHEVDRLFGQMVHLSAPGSRIAFTFIEVREDGSPVLGRLGSAFEWRLRRAGEPFQWGISRQDLPGFLEAHGWNLVDAPDKSELRRRYLTGFDDEPLLSWEHVAVAERA